MGIAEYCHSLFLVPLSLLPAYSFPPFSTCMSFPRFNLLPFSFLPYARRESSAKQRPATTKIHILVENGQVGLRPTYTLMSDGFRLLKRMTPLSRPSFPASFNGSGFILVQQVFLFLTTQKWKQLASTFLVVKNLKNKKPCCTKIKPPPSKPAGTR